MGVTYAHYLLPRDNTVRPEPQQIVALIEAWLSHGFIIRPDGEAVRDDTAQGHGPDHLRSPTGARFTTLSCAETEALDRSSEPPPVPPAPPTFWQRLLTLLLGAESDDARPVRFGPWPRTPFVVPPVGESLAALAKPSVLIQWDHDQRAVYPMQTTPFDRGAVPGLCIFASDDFENCHTDSYGVGGDTRQVIGTCGRCGHDLAYEPSGLSFEGTRIRRVCPQCGAAFRPQDQMAEIVDGATGDRTPQPGGMCYRFAIVLDFEKDHPVYAQNADGERGDNATPRVTVRFKDVCRTALGIELDEFGCYR